MTKSDWEQVKDLFARAVEQPPEKRRAFVREICGGDVTLETEIESLLAANDEPAHFIDNGNYGIAELWDAPENNYAGQEFGHYRIVREIGRGGMGAVFLAERADGEFNQQVALKIVRRSFADNELGKRFRRERQILAGLNHPNIAKLLDGGVSSDGEPFLVMEHIEGVRIDEFCDKQNLATNERLKLFRQVCAAISFAHQNLVVHRDIKPSNILVTSEGTPKLLDFGIAKLLDAQHADEKTQTDYRAFTPEYAAPEQIAGGQITTATDVYSLGVLLTHLVETPKIRIQVSSGAKTNSQDTTTNTGTRKISDELRAIIEMARRVEPERRYASVQQFSEDLERYLNGLPIRAQKDSFAYRAEKFVQRNRVSVFASALILLSLVAGLAISLWQANVARQQANLARVERDRATRRFDDVRQLANILLFDITPKIERLEGSTEARQILVQQSLKYLDNLAGEAGDDATLQLELAAAYEKIGSLQGETSKPNLGDFRGALISFDKARVIRRKFWERSNDAENRRLLAENLRRAGMIRWNLNETENSLAAERETLAIYEQLIAETPDSTGLQTTLCETQIEAAQGLSDGSKYAESVAALRAPLAALAALNQQSPENREILRVLAKGRATLGHALSWNEQQPEAETEMRQAIEITENLVAKNPSDGNYRQNLWATYRLASGIYEEIDNPRSFELADKARQVAEESIALDKGNWQARYNLAKTFSSLGQISANLKKPDAALSYLEKARLILGEIADRDRQNQTFKRELTVVNKRVGDAKYAARDLNGALAEFENAAQIAAQIYAVNQDALVLRDIVLARRKAGDIHADLARAAPNGEKRSAHLQAAKENYQNALDNLQKLESGASFAETDRAMLEELRAAVLK